MIPQSQVLTVGEKGMNINLLFILGVIAFAAAFRVTSGKKGKADKNDRILQIILFAVGALLIALSNR